MGRSSGGPRPQRKPAGRYHHGELRRALLDAALGIIEKDGTGAVSLSAAARRVGVSPQASYNHFRDKGALLAAIAEEGLRALEASMRAAGAPGLGEGERLEAIGVAYVTHASAHPAHFRLLSAPELADKTEHPQLLAAYEGAFGVLLAAIEACQATGIVRGADTRKLAGAAWAMVHGVAWLLVDGQFGIAGADATHVARDSVRVLFKGLEARGPRESAPRRK
ncbi:TetR/AcrR family transcriptional regulator [Pendulispora albinea]|uniref:TetR/AcrR family transcriptional regulator n=1 Tax=Pendulispora albinea TaxID=2741071 RepID=A0ABZ2M1P9_9BACT